MSGIQQVLGPINRRADAFVNRLGGAAAGMGAGPADGRFTLPGLVALLAVAARDRPRQPLVAEVLSPAVIERALDEIGRLRGVPVRVAEVRAVAELLTTGEVFADVATGLRATLVLVPRLPLALTRDALTLPDLPRTVADAIRADLRDDAPRSLRDVLVDLQDGKLEGRRRILTNTLGVLLAEATPGVLVETIRALIGPENQTLRLAVLVYARTRGIDLDEEDLDALFRALDPAHPDLGVLLDRGLERVTTVYGDAARAVTVLRRLLARAPSGVPA
jgi:hypothetical protein